MSTGYCTSPLESFYHGISSTDTFALQRLLFCSESNVTLVQINSTLQRVTDERSGTIYTLWFMETPKHFYSWLGQKLTAFQNSFTGRFLKNYRRTDRQTDKQTHDDSIYRAIIASRGNITKTKLEIWFSGVLHDIDEKKHRFMIHKH